MPIAKLTLDIAIEASYSLKDRRHVVQSVKEKLRNSFNISIAEMDDEAMWNRATLGIAAISNSRDYLIGLMSKIEDAAHRHANDRGAEISDAFWDFLEE